MNRDAWIGVAVAAVTLVISGTTMAAERTFVLTVRNISIDATLQLPDGKTVAAPTAPGTFAVLAPGTMLFPAGKSVAGTALERLAEDGDPEPLIQELAGVSGVKQTGLIIPGQPFSVRAEPGDRIAFASMFVQSNDLFYAPDPKGIALFDQNQMPIKGDITGQIMLWDAGTERNEAPGVGPNQAPRQAKPNTGPAEDGLVHKVNDGFKYPAVAQVLSVIIEVEADSSGL